MNNREERSMQVIAVQGWNRTATLRADDTEDAHDVERRYLGRPDILVYEKTHTIPLEEIGARGWI